MFIDLKCGKCETEFPIKKSEIEKRFTNEKSGTHHIVFCPSCLEKLPEELYYVVKFLSTEQGFQEWKVGSRFSQVQKP